MAEEYIRTRQPFVVIEQDEAVLEHWRVTHPDLAEDLLYLVGDATEEISLREAGIERAHGLIAALATDALNVLVVISSKFLNRDLKVIAKVLDIQLTKKIQKAGADKVICPTFIGGMRMASEMIRPSVVSFLDQMLRSRSDHRVAEVTVPPGSPLLGRLQDARIQERTGMVVIALDRGEGEGQFTYNPGPNEELRPGHILMVIGSPDAVAKLERLAKP